MESAPLINSSGFVSEHVLVVSHDRPFADRLARIAAGTGLRHVSLAFSYREAEATLERELPTSVFLDLRKAGIQEHPAPLLENLHRRGHNQIPIFAVAEEGYAREWAAIAHAKIAGQVDLPLSAAQVEALLSNGRFAAGAQELLDRTLRVIRSKSVSHRTYSRKMVDLLENLQTISPHDVTILLVGETGTGKTTMARMIHELSPRYERKLLTVACGALPPDLIESELFGHVKGAFTSADQSKIGKFEAAKDGSLLLDEIDVLTPSQQAKLLRVIETREYERVGCNNTRIADARLIAASNVNLQELMQRNEFRADLYYRLNMLEFHIPPLRKRRHDIVPLAVEFIDEFCEKHDVKVRRVHPDFLTFLTHYRWPGNVRELKNHVRRAGLFGRDGELTPSNLAPHLIEATSLESEDDISQSRTRVFEEATLLQRVADTEREMLEMALDANNQNRTATAKALGLSRVGLYKKMKKYGMITPRKLAECHAE